MLKVKLVASKEKYEEIFGKLEATKENQHITNPYPIEEKQTIFERVKNLKVFSGMKEYITELATERIIFESCSGEAALYFYDQMIRARDAGIAIKYNRLQVDNINYLQTHDEPLNSLKEAAARYNNQEDILKVNVSVIEEENGSLIVDVAVEDTE